jgi:uncharacterized protein (DUF697 family)/GTP-binding protein EngB required for normal cell division
MSDKKMDGFDFSDQVQSEFVKARKNIRKPNVLVAGGTGAGKSSLINMLFAGDPAPIGAGAPVTQDVSEYPCDQANIFDSPGYESGADSQRVFQDKVLSLIIDNKQSAERRIHMAWYCISQGNSRVLDIDTDTIKKIKRQGVPVAVVLTQADAATEEDAKSLRHVVTEACPGVEVFETSSDPELGLGVDPLLEWAASHIDEAVRAAFVAAAKGAIPLKLAEGKKLVLHHIGAAATIAASPIPFSDAPLLLANQAAMIARLANLWNLPGIQTVASGGLLGQLASLLGRTLAGNLLKIIPVFGTITGDVINVSVASSFTGGMGYGINEVCAKIYRDQLDGTFRDFSDYLDPNRLMSLFKSKAKEV